MVEEIAYKPSEPIRKTDFPFYPKQEYPPYVDVGVQYHGHSKKLSQGGGYNLTPQKTYHNNFIATTSDDTHTLDPNLRLFVTGIHLSVATKWLAGVHGYVDFEIEQDGEWGSMGFINQTLFNVGKMCNDTNLGETADFFIPFNPPMPVRLGTRLLRFKSNTSYSNVKWIGILMGFYDKEED